MLTLRKGKSAQSYENTFFRQLATQLTAEFNRRHWDGLLLGMPQSLALDTLQIDCLLVTDNHILIIDFKNYGGTLQLPAEADFGSSSWLLNGETVVKGGSSINPYRQIMRHRRLLRDLLETRIANFSHRGLDTIVCFQRPVQVKGTIPGKDVAFSIADSDTIVAQIVDQLDIEPRQPRRYLDQRALFEEILFTAPVYQLTAAPEAPHEVPTTLTKATPAPIKAALTQVQHFLASDQKILLLTGNTRSGKSALIPDIREAAFAQQYLEASVWVYSNRLKRRLLQQHSELSEVSSLFGAMFDFDKKTVDADYHQVIPLRQFEQPDEQAAAAKMLYIIDDSQLLANTDYANNDLQFGSGSLVNDLFAFLQLDQYPQRKLILIGDRNRLSYGKQQESVLNPAFLAHQGFQADAIATLALPAADQADAKLAACNQIGAAIQAQQFNDLRLDFQSNLDLMTSGDEKRALLKQLYTAPATHKMLVYTNTEVQQVNVLIKQHFSTNQGLCANDALVFDNTVNGVTDGMLDRIDNGAFAQVQQVAPALQQTVTLKGNTYTFTVWPCQVQIDDKQVTINILANYLQSDRGALTSDEAAAYQVLLKQLAKTALAQADFETSLEYQDMLAQGADYFVQNTTNKRYYLATDKRKLVPEEKAFEQRIEAELRNLPHTTYFKFYQAAHVRYAWAMTVNKALAYNFPHVYLNTNQGDNRGRTNATYFQWLYTGCATANQQLTLLNWTPITPFLNTTFDKDLTRSLPKTVLYQLLPDQTVEQQQAEFQQFLTTALNGTAWQCDTIVAKPYLYIVTLTAGSQQLTLFFDYNGKGNIKLPRLKAGDTADFDQMTQHLKTQVVATQLGKLAAFIPDFVAYLAQQGITTTIRNTQQYQVFFEFTQHEQTAVVHCDYDGIGLISHFDLIQGDAGLFEKLVAGIQAFATVSGQ
jgi:hypothetical protein